MKIKVGVGTNGNIYKDLDEVKACNFCTHFKGYGLHAVNGHCSMFDKDIDGGYIGNYTKAAKECNAFDVKRELIKENNPYKENDTRKC